MKLKKLAQKLTPQSCLRFNEPLAKHTFLKIGGKADLFYRARSVGHLIQAVKTAQAEKVPVTVLGRGSNVLIADRGLRGLVIKNSSDSIQIGGETDSRLKMSKQLSTAPRWESDRTRGTFQYEFKDLDYDESNAPRVRVLMDSGLDLSGAIDYLLERGITGLQWYAGIPGTIGGAVFNNIHGGTHFISEVIESVSVLSQNLKIADLSIEKLGLDYDKSRFHQSGEVILRVVLSLFKGDVNRARFVAKEWAARKSVQPRNSPGCTFANITQQQKEKLGLPTTSVGYIVEHVLKMSGFTVGDAVISGQHHNFIVNAGKASASDYLAVMKEIYQRAKDELGICLVPEIVLLGFEPEEIVELTCPRQAGLRQTRNQEIRSVYSS